MCVLHIESHMAFECLFWSFKWIAFSEIPALYLYLLFFNLICYLFLFLYKCKACSGWNKVYYYYFFLFPTFHSHILLPFPMSLTALHSVVNHCGWHSPISHSWTAAGLSRWEHSLAGVTIKSFPIFWTQMMSRRWVPLPHRTLHWKKKTSST